MESELIPLPSRARWLFHVRSFVRWAMLWTPLCAFAAVGLSVQFPFEWGVGVGAFLWAFGFLWAVWMPSLAFDRWGYRLTDSRLHIESGVLVFQIASIPFGRVQYVDVRQGLLDQVMGLATLRIHTASGLGVDAQIPGLELDDAERLKEELVARAKGDDGV